MLARWHTNLPCGPPPRSQAAALPLGLLGKGTGAPVQGVSLVNVLSQAFKPSIPKPPTEVAVPTIEWQPVTVMTPTVQVYKMGARRLGLSVRAYGSVGAAPLVGCSRCTRGARAQP